MPKPVNIAVVGYGLIGRRHADMINKIPETQLASIIDPSSSAQQDAQQSGVSVYNDIEEMLSGEQPDGILLATPTPLHLEQALLCINQGVPLFIEKPITVTSKQAQVLNDQAAKSNVPILVGHHRRHNGMVQAAKAALVAGDIGEIRAVQATCWFYKPDEYFEIAPWRKQKGAGPISVNLIHDVDLLRHFCGDVLSVQAVSVLSLRGYENEDLASAILKFKSGAIATISVSDSIVSPWSWELTARENPAYPATSESCYLIGGSEGGLSLPDLRVWRHQNQPDWWKPISAQNLKCTMEDPLAVQLRHFSGVITGREQPLVSGYEGMKSLEVVEAINTSASTGQEVRLDDFKKIAAIA